MELILRVHISKTLSGLGDLLSEIILSKIFFELRRLALGNNSQRPSSKTFSGLRRLALGTNSQSPFFKTCPGLRRLTLGTNSQSPPFKTLSGLGDLLPEIILSKIFSELRRYGK